jgi:hypothetical protein
MLGCLVLWWLGVFIAPNHQMPVGDGCCRWAHRTLSGALPHHPTIRVWEQSTVGAVVFMWHRTGPVHCLVRLGPCRTLFFTVALSALFLQSTVVVDRFENGFGIFRNFGNRFRFFRPNSSVSVFFGNGIGSRNFDSETVSESVRRFTDCFHRLPILIGILPDSNLGISENNIQPKPIYVYCSPAVTSHGNRDREPMGLAVAGAPMRQACWNLDFLSREVVRQKNLEA